MSESSLVFRLVASGIGLGLLFYFLVVDAGGLGLNLLLVQAALVATVGVFAKGTGHTLRSSGWIAGAFTLGFAAAFALRASSLGLAVAGIGFVVSQAVFLLEVIGHHADFSHPFQLAHSAFFVTPLRALSRVSIFRHVSLPGSVPPVVLPVFIGLCLLVPVLLLFGALFASADPLFERYASALFDASVFPVGPRDLIGVAFCSVAFVSVLGLAFWKRATHAVPIRPEPRGHTESLVVIVGVIVLFAAFLGVQAAYLFGGEAAFRATGYTFSEYARRGFHELAAVASFVLLLFLSLRYAHGDRATNALRVCYGILFIETLLVVVSAATRMGLYVQAYGYTAARLFVYGFLFMISVFLALAFVHLLFNVAQSRLIRQWLFLAGSFALAFVLMAPDAIATRLNATRMAANGVSMEDVLQGSAESYDLYRQLEADGVFLQENEFDFWSIAGRVYVKYYPRSDWRLWNWSRAQVPMDASFPWIGCVTPDCQATTSD